MKSPQLYPDTTDRPKLLISAAIPCSTVYLLWISYAANTSGEQLKRKRLQK